jgi:cytochrome c
MRHIAIPRVGLIALAMVAIFIGSSTPSLAQSAPNHRLFKQRCAVCHSVVAGKTGGVGPNLRGVVGRKSGATTFSYSPAMTKANLVWNQASLDRYLAGPTRAVPGTKMVIAVPDAAQRAEIIRYLSTVR